MKYVAVYCYYSPTGDVSRDALLLLKELKTVSNYIIVVVNGLLNSNSFDSLADEVFVRENDSFDFGAYRFAFANSNLNNILNEADGLILCNSSFFGPFVPLRDLFDKMSFSPCDFWGISSFEKNFSKHIQSYFLVFEKRILRDNMLPRYFEEHASRNMSYTDVCNEFEQGLFDFLSDHKYTYDAYCRDVFCDMYTNPYGSLRIDKLPILKKKVFSEKYYNEIKIRKTLKFIERQFNYCISSLLVSVKQIYGVSLNEADLHGDYDLKLNTDFCIDKRYSPREEIKKFIKKNKSIYIYGTGYDALCIYNIFFASNSNRKFNGFIDDMSQESCAEIRNNQKLLILKDIEKKSAIINACDFNSRDLTAAALKDYANVISCWKNQSPYTVSITASVSEALQKYDANGNLPLAVIDSLGISCGIISTAKLENARSMVNESVSNIYFPGYSFFAMDHNDSIEECRIFAETDIQDFPILNNANDLIELRSRIFPKRMYLNLLDFEKLSRNYRFVYIYGAGKYGMYSAEIIERFGIKIDSFLVTKASENSSSLGIPVRPIDSVSLHNEDSIVLIAMKQEFRDEASAILEEKGFVNYLSLVKEQYLSNEGFLPPERILKKQSERKFLRKIHFTFLLNGTELSLEDKIWAVKSIQAQSYQDWKLLITGDSIMPQLAALHLEDRRIRYSELSYESCIAQNKCDYIIYVDTPVIFHPAFLYETMKTICKSDADIVYMDDVYMTSFSLSGITGTAFKPDFSIDYLRSYNYIGRCFVFNGMLLDKECFSDDEIFPYSLILRLSEKTNRICHIPKIFSFHEIRKKKDDCNRDMDALKRHLARCSLRATVTKGDFPSTYHISYETEGCPLVSIIIPNFDHANTLRKCIDSIICKSSYKNYEIIIVENNSVEQRTFDYYDELRTNSNIRIVTWKEHFNFSEINNYGSSFAKGEYLLFLNNDTEVITENWLEEMLMFAQRGDVGAVGAKLHYFSGKIQHAGVFIGVTGIAGHSHRNYDGDAAGYENRLTTVQELSAVTGACIMIPMKVFKDVGGFTVDFEVAFNDVDLCMKIRKQGYKIIWTPYARLYHFESESRGSDATPKTIGRYNSERYLFSEFWSEELAAGDPFYNPNLTLKTEDMAYKNLESSVFHNDIDYMM